MRPLVLLGLWLTLVPHAASTGADAPQTLEQARAALAATTAVPEPLPLAEAHALEALAAVLVRERQHSEVEVLLQRAVQIRERVQGIRHPDLASTLLRLGRELGRQRRHREAEALYVRALAIQGEALGDNHPDLAATLYELGTARYFDGRPQLSIEPLARAALLQADDRLNWGYALPRTLERLASAHLASGAPDRALEVLEPWVERLASETGETLGIVELLQILGRAYRGVGQSDASDALFERRFAIFLARLGPADPLVGRELREEAMQAMMDGRMERAEALHRRRLALLEGSPDTPKVELAYALRAIGLAIEPGERNDEADALLAQALAIARESLAADDRNLSRFLLAKGESSARTGRLDDAIAYHEEALAHLGRARDSEASAIAEVQRALVGLRNERRALRLGPQEPPARLLREGIVYESQSPVPGRFDLEVTRVDRAHVEHAGQRIALWDLARYARERGAASLLVREMGEEDMCGGVLAIEHGVQVYFEHGNGAVSGLKLAFTEPDSVRRVWQMCRIHLAPDP